MTVLLLEASCQDMPLWEQAGTEYSSHTPYTEISKIFPILKNAMMNKSTLMGIYLVLNVYYKECILLNVHSAMPHTYAQTYEHAIIDGIQKLICIQ